MEPRRPELIEAIDTGEMAYKSAQTVANQWLRVNLANK